MIEMLNVKVKLLVNCIYGRITDMPTIKVSQQQLDALVKHKFIDVRGFVDEFGKEIKKEIEEPCIIKDLKEKKKTKRKK